MKSRFPALMFVAALFLLPMAASADEYDDTIAIFKKAGESAAFFDNSYAYLVFPTVGKGGLGVGAAHGSGRTYEQGKYVGDVKLNQLSIGLQAGGEGGSIAMLLMTDRAVNSFKKQNTFSLNADAGLTIVNYSARAEGSAGMGDVVVWSDAKGAYIGASLGLTDVNWDEDETRAYYGENATPSAVLEGKVNATQRSPLEQALAG